MTSWRWWHPTIAAAVLAAGVGTATSVSQSGTCHYGPGPSPDAVCTPGATVVVPLATLCAPGYTATVRHVSAATKALVFVRYGLGPHPAGEWEIDHLVSLELGGSNDPANLWPEPAPQFHVKDGEENRLHAAVCRGEVSLADAQSQVVAFPHHVEVPH